MPTTFNVIFLGNLTSMDQIDLDDVAENASALVGMSFGGVGDPLVHHVAEMSLVSDAWLNPGLYDTNNLLAADTFAIDGGSPQVFDSTAVFNATLTYVDGTSVAITAVVFQDTAGNTYLAPELTANADQIALEAGAIRSLTLNSVENNVFDGMQSDRDDWAGFVTCFAAGTMVQARDGLVPVETLRRGDLVLTMDHGFQPVRWTGQREVAAEGELAPVLIRKGALGNTEDLRVSPQHRMLVGGWRAEILLGEAEMLAPAKFLVNDRTIVRQTGGTVTYCHVMFDTHELIYAAGIPSESFHPGSQALTALGEEVREELFTLFPVLRFAGAEGYGQTARPVLRGYEARLVKA